MFKRRRTSTVLAAAALVASLAACGGESSSDSSSGGSSSNGESSSGPSSLTILAGSSTAQQLDPHKYKNIADFQYIAMVYDGLFEFSEGGEVKPMLAEASEFSADGTTFNITLKDGITFQDGTPIDAAAVKASLERGLTLEGSTVTERLSIVTGVEAVSDNEVAISVTETARTLPEILAGPEGRIVKVVDGDIALDPGAAASGPYKLNEFEPGGRAVFERIADYWDADFQGADMIEVTPTADASTRVTVLRAGDGDAGSVGGITVEALVKEIDAGSSDLQLAYFEHPTHVFLQFDRTKAPFNDVKVRQAIAHGIDLSQAPAAIFGSTAKPADAIVPSLDTDRPYDFDQDAARDLLEEAGLGDGFEFEMACYDGDFCKLAEAFQAQLAEIDVTVRVNQMPAADLRGRMAENSLDSALEGLAPLPSEANRVQTMFFSPGQRIAELGDRTEDARAIFDQILNQKLSAAETKEAYEDFNTFVWTDNVWYVPVIWYNNATLARTGIGNIERLYDAGTVNPRVLIPNQ